MKQDIATKNVLTLDVIIPCYNASQTLERAIVSVLNQGNVQRIYLVDDGSTDDTWAKIGQFERQFADKVIGLKLAKNSGVAMARNFGALHSDADLVAFLDVDDAYEQGALSQVSTIFGFMPTMSLLRLKLVPNGLARRYHEHPKFAQAWDILQMTVGGNTIFRRNIFLLCGGFPTHGLFRELGGEDGALGIALARRTLVGTLFEPEHQGVVHYCRDGMHAERLFEAYLFDNHDKAISPTHFAFAESVTQAIINRLDSVLPILTEQNIGRKPLLLSYE